MVTMLDCIKRSQPVAHKILDKAKEKAEGLKKLVPDMSAISQIFVIGSGSSFNAARSVTSFMEEVSGLQASVLLPNDLMKKKIFDLEALYIFVSQTGTSSLVRETIDKVKEFGCLTIAVSDDEDSPIAKAAELYIPLEVGGEEYGYRTVGFCATLLTLQVIGLLVGYQNSAISEDEFDDYLVEARKATDHLPEVIEDSLKWFDENKAELKDLRSLMYYGGGELYGIAMEGALKLMEVPRIYLSFAYEAEDGIHGPCYAFGKDDAILYLDGGGSDSVYAASMVSFSKNELGRGYLVGPEIIDERDLKLVPVSRHFKALEYVPAVQIISYEMALLNDVKVEPLTIRVPHVSTKYFQTHKG